MVIFGFGRGLAVRETFVGPTEVTVCWNAVVRRSGSVCVIVAVRRQRSKLKEFRFITK